jgi:uncharacterized protein (UPF0212 family)
MIVGVPGAATTMLSAFVALPAAFVALTVKLKVFSAVGVPEITPVAPFKLRPAGKAPLSTVHVIGALPLALSVCLSGAPTAPPGRDAVSIVGVPGAATTMLNAFVALPAAFVALTVKLKAFAAVGMPEITPVAPFKLKPVGKAPLSTVHVIGAFPLALSVCL